jgi:hypothetical protein
MRSARSSDHHDEFRVQLVRSINAWVATCKTCGWQSDGFSHPVDVSEQTLAHTADSKEDD